MWWCSPREGGETAPEGVEPPVLLGLLPDVGLRVPGLGPRLREEHSVYPGRGVAADLGL